MRASCADSPPLSVAVRRATARASVALAAVLLAGQAQAADKGQRPHAQGTYDVVTATYVVAEGDDLFAISERFAVPVEALKTHNKLSSNEVRAGQKLRVAASGSGHQAMSSHAPPAKKPLAKMTCEDFVALDETYQPKAVFWAVAYGKHGEPDAEAVDVEGIETVVPLVIQECQKAPKETFWEKVKAQWNHAEEKI